ncbi:glycosyltransferase family 39 protein [Amycolatopsis echigonensis]|uniref:Glycosyltransferase family 39 protein n=1 Tax=Amycolatopsis echigonensis TaxID=2576905 RepID=A0A8E1W2N4_9PSEU|nr:glycosyltransferase family 39 protein [Amycolatopsis echigonensis]MBB2503034.1 glycosyltransferase family 39 protein [Amycolatopsis echigonensis]
MTELVDKTRREQFAQAAAGGPAHPLRAAPGRWGRSGYVHAAVLYLVARLVSVGALAAMAAPRNLPLGDRLQAWDGWWYLQIAEHNYTGVSNPLDAAGLPYPDASYGYFPLYPALTGLLEKLPGVTYFGAGILLSTLAGIAAATAMYRIGRLVHSPRAGLLLAVLWGAAPMAIAESMVMTEALFTALAAWALVGVLERKWYLAAFAALFAGLTRSTACVLVAVVIIAAAIDVWRNKQRWNALLCVFVAPLGLLGYWMFVAVQTGSLTGWQDVELRGWNTRFDTGAEAWQWITHTLFTSGNAWETLVVLVTLTAVALAVITVTDRRVPWPLAAYAVGVVVLVLCSAGLPALKSRFLLPDFALLLPVAMGLAGRKKSTMIAATTVFVLVGAWYSAYSLTVWKYAI